MVWKEHADWPINHKIWTLFGFGEFFGALQTDLDREILVGWKNQDHPHKWFEKYMLIDLSIMEFGGFLVEVKFSWKLGWYFPTKGTILVFFWKTARRDLDTLSNHTLPGFSQKWGKKFIGLDLRVSWILSAFLGTLIPSWVSIHPSWVLFAINFQ